MSLKSHTEVYYTILVFFLQLTGFVLEGWYLRLKQVIVVSTYVLLLDGSWLRRACIFFEIGQIFEVVRYDQN